MKRLVSAIQILLKAGLLLGAALLLCPFTARTVEIDGASLAEYQADTQLSAEDSTGNVSSVWEVQYSSDGKIWELLTSFRIPDEDGSTEFDIPIPRASDDALATYVRFIGNDKGALSKLKIFLNEAAGESKQVFLHVVGDEAGNLLDAGFVFSDAPVTDEEAEEPENPEDCLKISEVCASNKTAYVTESGASPDWIELYNSGSSPMSLSGCYLSNDEEEPLMFNLSDYTLQPHEYLILKADGSEVPFKLSSSGFSLIFTIGDSRTAVDVPPLSRDQSYSLQPSGEWHVTEATPGAVNAAGEIYVEPPFVAPPKFSHTAGFFDDPFDLSLSGFGDVRIYYTTDGSVPDEESTLYTGPISIYDRSGEPNVWSARSDIMLTDLASPPPDGLVDKCNIIRAVAIDGEGNRSSVVTNTYFVGLRYDNIAVLSIVADPYDLFDENDGIYVLGKVYYDWLNDPEADHSVTDFKIPTNFGKTNELSSSEREISANFQLFEISGEVSLEQTLAIRVQGNWSRMRAQKSLKATARKEISGTKTVDLRLWEDLPKMSSFIIRGDGNGVNAPSGDVLAHMIISEQGQIYSRATPCLVFLESEFWGLYNLRPSMNEKYISAYTGISTDELVVIKNNELRAGIGYEDGVHGWKAFLNQAKAMDMTLSENYEALCELFDVDSYARFIAANLYLENNDCIGKNYSNRTLWRTIQSEGEGYADGRWRWIYQDMDMTFTIVDDLFDSWLPQEELFNILWNNTDFQSLFMDVLTDFMNLDCCEGRIEQYLNQYVSMYGPYIEMTGRRFNAATPLKTSQSVAAECRKFFAASRNTFLDRFISAMHVRAAAYRLKVDLSAVSGIALTVNGREIPYLNSSWTGQYFSGRELTLTASDVPSYVFQGWYEGDTLLTEAHTLCLTVSGDSTVAPRYTALSRLLDLTGKKKAALVRDEATLPASDYQIKAVLAVDDGLTLEGEKTLTITAEEKWAAKTGFTLKWNSNQYQHQQLFTTITITGDLPTKWVVSWSLDGSEWTKAQELKLKEGEPVQCCVAVPEELNDVNHAYLRVASEKKGGAGVMTLEQLIFCAETLPNSLANIKDYAAQCQALEGESYTAPDLEAMRQLTRIELEDAETAWRNRLVKLLLASQTGTVGQVLPDVVSLSYFSENPVYTITNEIIILSRTGWVSAGVVPDGTAYLYRYQNGQLTLAEECRIADGGFQIPLTDGVFVLMEDKLETLSAEARIETPALSQAMKDNALGGMYPLGSYELIVEKIVPGVSAVHVDALPGNEMYSELYVYFITGDDTLEEVGTAPVNGDGSYDIPCFGTGGYLLMTESLEDHLDYAEMMNTRRQTGK